MQLEACLLNIISTKTFLKNNTFLIRGWYAKSVTTKNDISFARSLRTTPFRKSVGFDKASFGCLGGSKEEPKGS